MRRLFPSRKNINGNPQKVALENNEHRAPPTCWDLLPVEIQIAIFAECGIRDFSSLRHVSRSFRELLITHELVIAQKYLRRRRHGTLPSTTSHERAFTMNPEDDVILLSDLFPPVKSAKGGYLYTFRYLHSLRRRQETCARLSYYLANRVMDRFFNQNQDMIKSKAPTKLDRDMMLEHGISLLKFNLIPLTYCVLYFLETYASARKECLNQLLRAHEAGKLPVPLPPHARRDIYKQLQIDILRSPPFTSTQTLLDSHHCMCLLVSCLVRTLSSLPGQAEVINAHWMGGLFTASGFQRVVEYFSAEIGDSDNTRMKRKQFMTNFARDIDFYMQEEMHQHVYSPPSDGHPPYPPIQEVWLDAAKGEIRRRSDASDGRHEPLKFDIWEDVPMLVTCDDCVAAYGWLTV